MRTERVIDNSFAAHGAWVSRIRSVPGVHGVVPRLESYALITSAREGLTAGQLEAQPLAGSLFVVKQSEWKGMYASRFGGV